MNGSKRLLFLALFFFVTFAEASAANLRFVREPQDTVALQRETAVLSALAEAPAPISYQWFKGPFAIPNETGSDLSILIVDEQDGGEYRVQARTATEQIFSRTATVSVVRRPIIGITEPLPGVRLPSGRSHRIATTNAAITLTNVSFYSGSELLATLTDPPFEIFPILALGEHTLRAVAFTSAGSADTSAPVTIRVEQLLPQFLLQPLSQRVMAGRTVEFRADAVGAGTVTYQWTRNGTDIPGATASNLVVQAIASATYRVIAKNEHGEALSDPSPLTVETSRPQLMQRFKRSIPSRPGDPSAFRSIAFGNGVIVIVGSAGSIIRSGDGLTWQDVSPPFAERLWRVQYLNGAFWTVSDRGAILNSSDGLTWTRRVMNPALFLSDIGYLNGVYVAIATDRVFRSTDAVNWTAVSIGSNFTSVTSGNGIFVAVRRQNGNDVHISQDGLTWQPFPLGGAVDESQITFFKGRFVVSTLAGIRTSANGQVWETSLPGVSGFWHPVPSPTRLLMLAPNNRIARSEDGITFVQEAGAFPMFNGGIYSGAGYYAIGLDPGPAILSSLNGLTWKAFEPTAIGNQKISVDFAGDRFFACGGSQKVDVNPGSEPWDHVLQFDSPVRSVTHDGGKYFAVAPKVPIVQISQDGESFSQVTSAGFPGAQMIRFQEGEFLAVNDDAQILRSANALAWSSQTVAGGRFIDIGKFNNKAIAVGFFGVLALSENGGPWEEIPTGTTTILSGIGFQSGRYVVVGNDAFSMYSIDGRNWFRGRANFASAMKEIVFAEGMFLAAGDQGRIAFSWDGINWDFEQLHTGMHLYSIASGNGRLVAGGDQGALFQTAPLVSPEPAELAISASVSARLVTIQMLGAAGQTIRLESASELPAPAWNLVGRFPMTGQPVEHTFGLDQANRFYRAVTESQ